MAQDRDANNGRIIGDLAYSHALLGSCLTSAGKDGKEEYSVAEKLFQKAEELEPKYPPIAYNWSTLKFFKGEYKAAKEYLDRAISLGYEPDPAYVKELEAKLK